MVAGTAVSGAVPTAGGLVEDVVDGNALTDVVD
jgi:hypothetical protein